MGIDHGGQRIAQFMADGRGHLAAEKALSPHEGGVGGVEFGRALGHQVGGVAVAPDEGLDSAAHGQGQKEADAEKDVGGGVGEPAGQGASGRRHHPPGGGADGDGIDRRRAGERQGMGIGRINWSRRAVRLA